MGRRALEEIVYANRLAFMGTVAGEKFGMHRSKQVVNHCFNLKHCERILLCAHLLI